MTPLEVARCEIGYVEQGGPHGNDGNITKYWDWWDAECNERDQGASWCGCFVSWCFDQAGARFSNADSHQGPGFIYCPGGENWFRSQGLLTDVAHAQPNDVAFFHFVGEPDEANHTGIVESVDPANQTITCIEGNTSIQVIGSQSNGGGVYRRTRPWSCVRSIAHTPWVHPTQEEIVQTKTVRVTVDHTSGRGYAATGVAHDKFVAATAVAGGDGSVVKVGVNPQPALDGEAVVNVDLGGPTLVDVPVDVLVGFNS